ncbi:MAG TPA: FmdB family zinc ribbon protein [Chthoniobacterales bacterium]|nr:FmdB family zinc ribbon protein [Chthoniobacterales bacterium]
MLSLRQTSAPCFLMPTYEYHCTKCDQNFEAFQSMRDEPFRECPKQLCRLPKWGHGRVKRLLGTGAGIIFKGSGFYTTDYRSDSYKKAAKIESPATSAPEKSGEPSKTEKKVAPSTTTPPGKTKKESAA